MSSTFHLLRPVARQTCLRSAFAHPTQRQLLAKPASSRTFFSNAFRQQHSQSRPIASSSQSSWIATQLRPFARFQSGYAGFAQAPPAWGSTAWWTRVATTAGVVAAGTVAINFFLNRETREPLDAFEQSYLNRTFGHFGAGLAIVTAVAVAMHRNGLSYRIMRANPFLVMGVSLVGGIGSMLAVFYTNPENTVAKYGSWIAFQAFQAATLSPLLFMSPALLARAGLYTAGMLGSIAWIGATAKTDQYLYLGGPLLAGLVVVALSSLAPLVLPATAFRTLAISQSISLYGGLAVFGGLTLYDVQKILAHARMVRAGVKPADPVAESISIELDFINVFIRMVMILSGGSSRRR